MKALNTRLTRLNKQLDYLSITMQMARYDRWFKQLAEKTGIDLK